MIAPVAARLADGYRLHFQHGPIDLILEVTGPEAVVEDAEVAAWDRFTGVLDELVAELSSLRVPVTAETQPRGAVAQRMVSAARSFPGVFVTPMAGVAGSIADEICSVIAAHVGIRRAYVNNGGDIALHLEPGESTRVGLVERPEHDGPTTVCEITSTSGIRGVATSGWNGRSFSLGIADAVTVFATSAALADVAATLVANAVDLPGHRAIEREPAHDIDPESDLGDRLVTVAVGTLAPDDVDLALDRGVATALQFFAANPALRGVVMVLAGSSRSLGDVRVEATTPGSGSETEVTSGR